MYTLSVSWSGLAAAASCCAAVALATGAKPLHLFLAGVGGAAVGIATGLRATYLRSQRAAEFFETGILPSNVDFKLGDVVCSVIAASKKPKGQRLDLGLLSRAVAVLCPSIEDVAALSSCCILSFQQCTTIVDALLADDFWPTDTDEKTVFHWKRQLSSMHPVMMLCIGSRMRTRSPALFLALAQETGMPGDLFTAAIAF